MFKKLVNTDTGQSVKDSQCYDNNCARFHKLYDGCKSDCKSCYNNQIGNEYICPVIKPSGGACDGAYDALGSLYQAQTSLDQGITCFNRNPNIGVHELCSPREAQNQSGGMSGKRKNNKKGKKNYRSRMVNDKYSQVGGGCGNSIRETEGCSSKESYGPNHFNLASLKLPEGGYRPQAQTNLAGYAMPKGCPYNLMCTCGPNCPCGPSCSCGQDNKVCCQEVAVAREKPLEGGGDAVARALGCSAVPRDAPYTCQREQCITKDGCPSFDSTCRPNNAVSQFVCGGQLRCGNGELDKTPGCGCDCNCQEVIPKIWNQPVNPNRHYGLTQPEEVPGYYLDVSQPPIGGRSVQVQSNREAVPSMLLCNETNLPGRCFGCKQPCWNKKCL